MTFDILKWKIDEVSLGIDRDRMCMRHIELSDEAQVAIYLLEHRDSSRFGRDVEALQTGVKCQDIWIVADRMHSEQLHGFQIENSERMVFLTRNKGEPIRDIEPDTMGILDSRKRITSEDLHRRRIDRHQLVYAVHGDKNVS
jgi:hypothetical protein